MDVLKPSLVWVGNRCYRKNFIETQTNENYAEDDEVLEVCNSYADESCEIDLNIEATANGSYKLSLPCPAVCFGLVIGRKGETKKKIESDTHTQIRIPRQGESGNIEILGKERNGVASAHTRISVLIETARRRQPFTHFISFPMNSPSIQVKFDEFKEDVQRFCGNEKGVDATIFQNRNKLHLTVGTLTLLDDNEVEQAEVLLDSQRNDLLRRILKERPLVANVRGLEYMNDDPNSVDVLYAKVSLQDGSSRLQDLADDLVDQFAAAGLMERQYDHVKLHITVMNTLFRKESNTDLAQSSQSNKLKSKERECFDARNILKHYGNYEFGMHHIDCIHLSQRMTTSSNGYYASAGYINLP